MVEEKTQEVKSETQVAMPKENLVEKAQIAARELKVQLDRKEELIKREEQAKAAALLGGKAEAGQPIQEREETPREYARRIERGQLKR